MLAAAANPPARCRRYLVRRAQGGRQEVEGVEKLNCSVSTSGLSRSHPIAMNVSATCSANMMIGCRAPAGASRRLASVSIPSATSTAAPRHAASPAFVVTALSGIAGGVDALTASARCSLGESTASACRASANGGGRRDAQILTRQDVRVAARAMAWGGVDRPWSMPRRQHRHNRLEGDTTQPLSLADEAIRTARIVMERNWTDGRTRLAR